MNKNIDLGTFTWDISKLEAQIIQNRTEMEAFSNALNVNKKALKDDQKEMQNLAQQIALMKDVQKSATQQLKDGAITQDEYNETVKDSNKVILQNETAIKSMAVAQSAQIKTIIDQENAVKGLRTENTELNKLFSSGRTEVTQNEGAYKNLNKELNALKIESKNLGAELLNLEKSGKKGTKEYADLEKQFNETSKKANDLNDEFKALDKSVGDNQRSVGDYKDQIKGALDDVKGKLLSGDLKGAFSGIKDNIGGIAKAFLANPFGIVLAGLSALALGFKEVFKYNEEQLPKIRLLENAFGDLGDEADVLRAKINGVSEQYGVSFERITETVDSLSSAGLGTEIEAIDAIKKGLATAPNADEFLSKLDSAASKARQTGISLTEVLNLTKALQGTAINPDTIYGGLEKAAARLQLGLKDNTALVSAFGESFTKDLLGKIQSGQLTTVSALEEVRKKGDELGISLGKQAELGKELFGKVGASAGAYNETLRLVGEAYKDQYADLTDLQKATLELSEENEKLAIAKDKALKSDTIIAFKEEFDLAWIKIQVGFYNLISYIPKLDKAVQGSAAYVRGLFKSFPESAGIAFSSVLTAFQDLLKGITSGGGAIAKFFKGDFDGAKEEANKFINAFPTFIKKIKNIRSDFGKNLSKGGDSERGNFNKSYDIRQKALAEISRKEDAAAEAASEKTGGAKSTKSKGGVSTKGRDDALKKVEEEAKRSIEIAKNEADQKTDIAKLALADYIRTNALKLDSEKRLTAEKLQAQIKYYDEVKRLQSEADELERKSKESAIQVKIDEINAKALLNQNDLDNIKILKTDIENLNREYAGKEVDLTNETNAKKKEVNTAFEAQTIEDKKLMDSIEFQNKLLEIEENGNNAYEFQQEQLNEQRDLDLAKLEEDRTTGLISLENYEANKSLIQRKYTQATKDIEDAKNNAILTGYAGTLGAIAELMGQNTILGKTFAVAQATITGYQAVMEAYKTAQASPITILNPAYPFIQAGIAGVFSGAQIIKIVSTPIPNAKPKAARGMLINGPSHSNGGVNVNTPNGNIEAEGGEPILTKKAFRMFPSLISEINVAGGGIPLYARGGVVSSNMSGVQKSIQGGLDYGIVAEMLRDAVMEGSAIGTQSGAKKGISDLDTKTRIIEKANF